jgi:AcrR family transcriptional regulator
MLLWMVNGPTKLGGPKARETVGGGRTRREILKQAVNIASAEGLEGLTIARLAKEVSMSKRRLFAHFGSKVDHLLATIDTARDIFIEAIVEPASKIEAGIKRLRVMVELWFTYVGSNVVRRGASLPQLPPNLMVDLDWAASRLLF